MWNCRLKLTRLKKKERFEHAETALKLVGLGDRFGHLPKQLSGGQEQRVAIARAIVTDPDLILADEPTGNLDAASAEDVLTMLTRLNREFGKTIIMVTHDPHAAKFARHDPAFGERAVAAAGNAAGGLGYGNGGACLSVHQGNCAVTSESPVLLLNTGKRRLTPTRTRTAAANPLIKLPMKKLTGLYEKTIPCCPAGSMTPRNK